jgi:hypothetical protein
MRANEGGVPWGRTKVVKTLHAQHAQQTRASGVSGRTQLLENVRARKNIQQ